MVQLETFEGGLEVVSKMPFTTLPDLVLALFAVRADAAPS